MSLTVTAPNTYNDLRRPVRFRVTSDLVSQEAYTIYSATADPTICNMTLDKTTYPTIAIKANDVVQGSGFTGGFDVYNTRFNIISITEDASFFRLHCEVLINSGTYNCTAVCGSTITRDNDVRLKNELTVSGSLLTTFYMSYSELSYIDVYIQRYLRDLISLGTVPSLSAFGSVLDSEDLLKSFDVLFTEQYIDSGGTVHDADTDNQTGFYGIDALRPIENSNINDHIIVSGFAHSWLTDRNYIRIKPGDVYHLCFVTSETTVRIKTFEDTTLKDSRDVTPTNGYVSYSFVAGSENRAVGIYTTGDVLISEVIYFVVENNCRPDRVYYRNRWGGYDMDYINVEINTNSKKDLIETIMPYSYDYQKDRAIQQVNKSNYDTGTLITPPLSDLHAWQLVDSNDVYLILNGKLYPIIITSSNLPRTRNKLTSIKATFKFSNYGNTYS